MRRHHRQSQNNHVHRWTVSYADYMTLMFALFVVLYAVSLNKEEKYQDVIHSIQNASQFLHPSREGTNAQGILSKRSNDIKETYGPALLSDGEQPALGYVSELPSEQLSNVNQYYTGEPLSVLQQSLQSAFQTELEAGLLSVDLKGDWLTIEMNGSLLFAAGSHTLLNATKIQIERLGKLLKPVNNMLRLRGYTDMTPIADEIYASNWELSALRAISVLHALNAQGIAGERMVVEGFGKFQPILFKNGRVDKLKSRRVVIAISKFALFDNKEINRESSKSVTIEQQKIQRTPKPDSKQMREVYLPNNRLIITTRQE